MVLLEVLTHLRDFFSMESLREEVNEEISSEDIADTILTELRRINPKRVGNVSPDVFFYAMKVLTYQVNTTVT